MNNRLYVIIRNDGFYYNEVDDIFSNINTTIYHDFNRVIKNITSLQKCGHEVNFYLVTIQPL